MGWPYNGERWRRIGGAVICTALLVLPPARGVLAQTPHANGPSTVLLSLDECIGIALENQPAIQAQHAAMCAAVQRQKIARSYYLPQLGFQARYTHIDEPRSVDIPLMDQFFLHKLVEQEGHTVETFFESVEECSMVQSAILVVRRGEADCLVLNIVAYSRHIANQPKLDMQSVERSEPFPEPVLVGRRELVNALRPGLWEEVQEKLTGIHRTAQGRQCLDFWKEEEFALPDQEDFDKLVDQRVRDYPITMLEKVALGGRP